MTLLLRNRKDGRYVREDGPGGRPRGTGISAIATVYRDEDTASRSLLRAGYHPNDFEPVPSPSEITGARHTPRMPENHW